MKKYTINIIIIAVVSVAVGLGIGAALSHYQEPQPPAIAAKSVDHYSMSTITESQTREATTFKAWCVSHFTDGSNSRKYLGEFKIYANMPKQFGFVANGCENTNPNS